MELIALWQVVKRRWWLIGLPGVVALLLTLPQLTHVVAPPVTYSVAVRLSAAAPPQADLPGVTTPYEDSVYVPLLASEYVVVNLPHWITSSSFADAVGEVLAAQGIEAPRDDLRRAFAADGLRSILTLYVGWEDADDIRAITQAAITVLQTRNQDYFPQFAAEPVEVVPLDAIVVNEAAPPITVRLEPLLRIGLGVAAGVGLAILAEYLDRSIRTRADVEGIGLPVLAEIPRDR